MRCIIAGSRTMPFAHLERIQGAISDFKLDITEVICGEALGADTLGKVWAVRNKIPVSSFKADWKAYGKSAGRKRNELMASVADMLLVFIYDGSPGSTHMLTTMQNLNKPCVVIYGSLK